jgi:branched-chain amino acid transport system ATP-binding protein
MNTIPLLSVSSLTRHFGGLAAVTDLSFELQAGEILGLIGPNGAGKSTTFNLISGFLRPQAGEVRFQGLRINGFRPHAISKMGLVRTFQHDSLFKNLSVIDNALVGATVVADDAEDRKHKAIEALRRFGLSKRLNERAGELPHGQQRLLSMAIAYATQPRLICLDEPLTGLHQLETREVLDLIRQLRGDHGTSVLFVEHNVKAVMNLCDRIVVLDQGRKIAEGKPGEIARDPAVIKAYLGEGEAS